MTYSADGGFERVEGLMQYLGGRIEKNEMVFPGLNLMRRRFTHLTGITFDSEVDQDRLDEILNEPQSAFVYKLLLTGRLEVYKSSS